MKPERNATALAERLAAAANKPVPLPEAPPSPPTLAVVPAEAATPAVEPQRAAPKKAKAAKVPVETVPITLRPSRALLTRYTMEAVERTRETGRVTSAQEMMLERLERAR